jgi:hypothetical protein
VTLYAQCLCVVYICCSTRLYFWDILRI